MILNPLNLNFWDEAHFFEDSLACLISLPRLEANRVRIATCPLHAIVLSQKNSCLVSSIKGCIAFLCGTLQGHDLADFFLMISIYAQVVFSILVSHSLNLGCHLSSVTFPAFQLNSCTWWYTKTFFDHARNWPILWQFENFVTCGIRLITFKAFTETCLELNAAWIAIDIAFNGECLIFLSGSKAGKGQKAESRHNNDSLCHFLFFVFGFFSCLPLLIGFLGHILKSFL